MGTSVVSIATHPHTLFPQSPTHSFYSQSYHPLIWQCILTHNCSYIFLQSNFSLAEIFYSLLTITCFTFSYSFTPYITHSHNFVLMIRCYGCQSTYCASCTYERTVCCLVFCAYVFPVLTWSPVLCHHSFISTVHYHTTRSLVATTTVFFLFLLLLSEVCISIPPVVDSSGSGKELLSSIVHVQNIYRYSHIFSLITHFILYIIFLQLFFTIFLY